jgi:hypothetical protein
MPVTNILQSGGVAGKLQLFQPLLRFINPVLLVYTRQPASPATFYTFSLSLSLLLNPSIQY